MLEGLRRAPVQARLVGWAEPAIVCVPSHSITSSGKTDIVAPVTSLDNVERRRA